MRMIVPTILNGLRLWLRPVPRSRPGAMNRQEHNQAITAFLVSWVAVFSLLRLAVGDDPRGIVPSLALVPAFVLSGLVGLYRLGQGEAERTP